MLLMKALGSLLLTVVVPAVLGREVSLGGTTIVGRDIPTLKQEFFGGIPFAEPPVGALRLRPPVGKTVLPPGKFDATQYGPGCLQPATNISGFSEDCLTLNILRPQTNVTVNPTIKLPVMVWIYGGGFLTGNSATFNGSAIVAQSVLRGTPTIFVSLNYRTGPLGFPQGSEVGAENSTNLGLRDQVAALNWVKKNIIYFGGDKDKITVFGESAGAMSIAIHQLRPNFANLTRAVILESGSAGSTLANYPDKREVDFAHFVGNITQCASYAGKPGALACLRSANLTGPQLILATGVAVALSAEEVPFVPTLGDDMFPALPSVVLKTGNYSKIPFIAGTNLDEGTAFIPFRANVGPNTPSEWLHTNFTPSLVPEITAQTIDGAANTLLQLYPDDPAIGSPYGTGSETFGLDSNYKRISSLLGDLTFQSQRRLLQEEAAADGVPTFGYLFTDPQPQIPPYLGVTHGQEVTYVFGSCATRTPATQQLCLRMIDYWVSFATSLTPNDGKGSPRPTWTQYSTNSPAIMELNGANTTLIPDDYRKDQIAYINQNSVLFHHRRATPQ